MISCILKQTYTNWELLIIDDCSSDNTQDIIRSFEKEDNRIIFFIRNRLPKGAQTCRNIGLDNAGGEFIVLFDADDLISATCLQNRVELLQKNPHLDYISFPAKSFIDDTQLPNFNDRGRKYGVGSVKNDLLTDLLNANYSSIVWTNIYRTSSIKNLKWDEKVTVYQDFDFALSVVLSGLKHSFSNLHELDYFYRVGQHNTISSNFISDEKCTSTIYLFSKTLDSLKLRSDYKKRKQEFKQFIVLHFERLIVDGSISKTNDYISFCKKYYPLLTISRLFIIKNISLFFTNVILRKLFLYFLSGTLFFRIRSILMFGSTLKHWR